MTDCALPPFTPVIAYLRVSGDVQKEHGTIVGQLDALERYVAEHQLTLIHPPFIDEAKPGSSASPRDAFQAMFAFTRVEPRPCDGVIFWSWSRFARDQDDAHFYKADLRRRGYTLISLSDGIPPDTGIDYVMEALIHWKDEEYLKALSLQTKRACTYSRGSATHPAASLQGVTSPSMPRSMWVAESDALPSGSLTHSGPIQCAGPGS